MRISRRSALSRLAATWLQALFPSRARGARGDVRHILPTATATGFGISVSVASQRAAVSLRVGERRVAGQKRDTHGRFWFFSVNGLQPATEYQLQLADEDGKLGDAWPLKTFPEPESLPEDFRLLAFTCAGGEDGFGPPPRGLPRRDLT